MKILTLVIMFCLSAFSRGDGTDEILNLSRDPVGKTAEEILGECLASTNSVDFLQVYGVSSGISSVERIRAIKMLGASQDPRAKDVLYELFASLPPVKAGTDVSQKFETLVLTQLLGKLDLAQKKVLLVRAFNQEINALMTTYRTHGNTTYYPNSLLALVISNIEKEKFVGEMRQQFEAASSDTTFDECPRITIRKALVHYELQTTRQLPVADEISALVHELRPSPMLPVPYDVYNDPQAYRKYLEEDQRYRRESEKYVLWRKSPEGIQNMTLEQLLGEYGEKSIAYLLSCIDNQVYDRMKSDYLAWLASDILKSTTRKKALSDDKQRLYKQKIYTYSLSMDNSVYGGYFQEICSNLGFENPKLLR